MQFIGFHVFLTPSKSSWFADLSLWLWNKTKQQKKKRNIEQTDSDQREGDNWGKKGKGQTKE